MKDMDCAIGIKNALIISTIIWAIIILVPFMAHGETFQKLDDNTISIKGKFLANSTIEAPETEVKMTLEQIEQNIARVDALLANLDKQYNDAKTRFDNEKAGLLKWKEEATKVGLVAKSVEDSNIAE